METQSIFVNKVPAIVWGPPSTRVFLYVHGKGGSKEEAAAFSEIVCRRGVQVLSVDLPEHGQRKAETAAFDPWHAVPELQGVMDYAKKRWKSVSLFANSIGAWFGLLSFGSEPLEQCLFVSPVVDMKRLVADMMSRANVSEAQLRQRRLIPTELGETLSWAYWEYILAHPVAHWAVPTWVLYGERDGLTDRETIEGFCRKFHCDLTVMANGEHWFHTPEQLAFLGSWVARIVPDEEG